MRQVFDSIDELVDFVRDHPDSKQMPYEVEIDGIIKYTLSCNSDQAIAAVARRSGVRVQTVPLRSIVNKAG